MVRLFIFLLVALSLVATPVLAGDCVYAGNSLTITGDYDSISKQKPDKGGKAEKSMAHCCVCVHAVGLSDRIAVHISFITKPVFLAAQDVFAPDYNPSPLLEPPSHV
jgi:hypothetical protein